MAKVADKANMRLYINGNYLGECRRYYQDRQDRARKTWVFVMCENVRYRIAADEIKRFERAGELRLNLRGIPGRSAEDSRKILY